MLSGNIDCRRHLQLARLFLAFRLEGEGVFGDDKEIDLANDVPKECYCPLQLFIHRRFWVLWAATCQQDSRILIAKRSIRIPTREMGRIGRNSSPNGCHSSGNDRERCGTMDRSASSCQDFFFSISSCLYRCEGSNFKFQRIVSRKMFQVCA